jgi:hypothetical protein
MDKGLFRTAIILTVSYMGTTVFAVVVGFLVFVVSMLIKFYREGWTAVRASWIGDVGWGVVVAGLIWLLLFLFCLGRAMEQRNQKGEGETASNSLSLSERVRILAAQISSFYNGRSDTDPGPLGLALIPTAPQEWNEAILNSKRYGRETNDLYLQRFAPQVTSIINELCQNGLIDTELNEAYLLNSDSLLGIESIADRLRALADKLPPSLHDTRNQLAVQQSKITALERDAPRHLDEESWRIITARLAPLVAQWSTDNRFCQVGVYHMPGNDCAQYALEFSELFESLGCQVMGQGRPRQYSHNDAIDDFRRGIFIMDYPATTREHYGRPPFGDVLQAALAEVGIEAERLDRNGSFFCIIIGAKP